MSGVHLGVGGGGVGRANSLHIARAKWTLAKKLVEQV